MSPEVKEKIKFILEQNNRTLMEQIEKVFDTSTMPLPNKMVILKDDKKLEMYEYRVICIPNWTDEKDITALYTMYDKESEEGNPNPQVLYERNMSADPEQIWSLLSLKLRRRKGLCVSAVRCDYFFLNQLAETDFLKMLDTMILKYNK
jgi:hypothetical protein